MYTSEIPLNTGHSEGVMHKCIAKRNLFFPHTCTHAYIIILLNERLVICDGLNAWCAASSVFSKMFYKCLED